MTLPTVADLYGWNLFQYDASTLQSLLWHAHGQAELSKNMTEVFKTGSGGHYRGTGRFGILLLLVRDRYPDSPAPILDQLWNDKGFDAKWEDMSVLLHQTKQSKGGDEKKPEGKQDATTGMMADLKEIKQQLLATKTEVSAIHAEMAKAGENREKLEAINNDLKSTAVSIEALEESQPDIKSRIIPREKTAAKDDPLSLSGLMAVLPRLTSQVNFLYEDSHADPRQLRHVVEAAADVTGYATAIKKAAETAYAAHPAEAPIDMVNLYSVIGEFVVPPPALEYADSTPSTATMPGSEAAWEDLGRRPDAMEKYAGIPSQSQRAVMKFAAAFLDKGGEEGVHVKQIADGLPGFSVDAVNAAIESLLDEGLLYGTTDEKHVLPAY